MSVENAVKPQRVQWPGYKIPKTKESSAKRLRVLSSSVGSTGGREQAETEEQESAEMGHTAQEKGEKSLFKNSHLPIELSVESQGVLCAELDRR